MNKKPYERPRVFTPRFSPRMHRPPVPVGSGRFAVILSKGALAFVDAEDAKSVSAHTWHISEAGGTSYAATNVWDDTANAWKRLYMHRMLVPDAVLVDHVDCNGLNNTRANLRSADYSKNAANSRHSGRGTSAFKGVHWASRHQRWIATIHVNGRRKHVGMFDSEEDAAKAYAAAARGEFGEYARADVDSSAEAPFTMRRDNKSGLKWVSWNKQLKAWVGQYMLAGRKRYVGTFVDPHEAHSAVKAARQAELSQTKSAS